jgi:hypothetical protein
MSWALERWLAPYIHEQAPATSATSATSAISDTKRCPNIAFNVADVASVAMAVSQSSTHGWSEADKERAALIEHDGGAPRAWAEALARLDPARPSGDVPPKRWLRFIDDCGRFLDDGWAHRAVELGWTPFDLFGCDRFKPFARVGRCGLLWLLNGRQLRILTTDTAVINIANGSNVTFYRRPHEPGQVLAWELAP